MGPPRPRLEGDAVQPPGQDIVVTGYPLRCADTLPMRLFYPTNRIQPRSANGCNAFVCHLSPFDCTVF